MSHVAESTVAQKQSTVMRIILLVCGVVAMVVGVAKMSTGIKELTGSAANPQSQADLVASDALVAEADKATKEAAEPFQQLLAAVDAMKLDDLRRQKRDIADQLQQKFSHAAAQLRGAAEKLARPLELETSVKAKEFLQKKAQAYELLAEVCDANVAIVHHVMDESLDTTEGVVARVLTAAEGRDAKQKQALEASSAADAIAKAAD